VKHLVHRHTENIDWEVKDIIFGPSEAK
jgi:hypothetical protein